MSGAVLSVTGVDMRRGGRTVVALPELALFPGEVLAVVGANGAGKSSLIQALALLAPARFDSYRFAGSPVLSPAGALAVRRQMAVVFQRPLLLEGTVAQNAAAGLRLRGTPAAAARQQALAWLERLGIGHLAGRHARELSSGEAQRVSLARALVLQPRVLFLDEPFAGLDAVARGALLRDLPPLLRESGMATVLVTHDYAEVLLLAHRVLVLGGGRPVQSGSPRQVLDAPAGPEVAALVQPALDLARALGAAAGGTAH